MYSLTARLSLGLVVALILLAGVALVTVNYSLRQLTEGFVLTRLEHDIDYLLTLLRFDARRHLSLAEEQLQPVFRQPYSGHYYTVLAGDQVLRSRSLWDAELALPPPDGRRVLNLPGPAGQQLLVLERRVTRQGQPLRIAVAEDFTPLAQGVRELLLELVLLTLVVLSVLGAGQYLIVRRGLWPLRRVGEDIRRLGRGEIRQLDMRTPLEIRPLVDEINHLLATLEQRLQRSRHALGNLAHALKTPLAVLTQIADRLPGDAGGQVAGQTERIRQLVDRELKRARIAGPASPGQRVLLAAEVDDLAATLQRIYRDKPLDLQIRIDATEVFKGDRDDLLELLGNLLDNACQWARGVVRLSIAEGDRLVIEDDGPGCPPAELERLTRRGQRLDEQRRGHGLGLAIVADIVEQYAGALSFDRSPELGGLRVTVSLPALDG